MLDALVGWECHSSPNSPPPRPSSLLRQHHDGPLGTVAQRSCEQRSPTAHSYLAMVRARVATTCISSQIGHAHARAMRRSCVWCVCVWEPSCSPASRGPVQAFLLAMGDTIAPRPPLRSTVSWSSLHAPPQLLGRTAHAVALVYDSALPTRAQHTAGHPWVADLEGLRAQAAARLARSHGLVRCSQPVHRELVLTHH